MKVAGVNFIRTKYDGLDGKTTVSYREETSESDPFTIKSTRSGFWFEGKMHFEVNTMKALQEFAKLTSMAWDEHSKLSPKLQRNLSGH